MPHLVLRHRQSAKDPALTVSAWRLGGQIERQPCQLAAHDLHTGHVKGRPGIAAQTRMIGKLPTGSGGRLARASDTACKKKETTELGDLDLYKTWALRSRTDAGDDSI